MKLRKRKDSFGNLKKDKATLKPPLDYWLPSKIILTIVIFDQATKILAGTFLPVVCNTGVAFGIRGGGIYLSLAVLAIVLFLMQRERSRNGLVALAFLFAGGFSNFIDRAFFGCVRDFINLKYFPVFNFADVSITFGVGLVIYFLIFVQNEKA